MDVVRIALGQARAGDLGEPCLLQLRDGPRAADPHGRPQTPGQLVGHRAQRSAVGHPALDALRHQLVLAEHVVLEVPVLRERPAALAVAHCPDRAHPPAQLVLFALDDDHLAGALLAPGQQAAQHHGVGPGRDRLGDGTRVLHAAVPTAARTTSRPCGSFVALGNLSLLVKSLTVISPPSRPEGSTSGSFSTLLVLSRRSASSRRTPTGAVTSGIGVITSVTRRSWSASNLMSRFVTMPSRTPPRPVTRTPHTPYPEHSRSPTPP